MKHSRPWVCAKLRAIEMIRTKPNTAPDSGWDVAFWFAILSPVIGVLIAFVALTLLYH